MNQRKKKFNQNRKDNNIFVKNKKIQFNKFLEKSDIIEIAIRSPRITNEDELKLIALLYKNLKIPINETISLYKLLIYYEQISTFEKLTEQKINKKEVK